MGLEFPLNYIRAFVPITQTRREFKDFRYNVLEKWYLGFGRDFSHQHMDGLLNTLVHLENYFGCFKVQFKVNISSVFSEHSLTI